MDSTEAHLNQLTAATERLMNALIDKKGINSLIDGLTTVISLVANFTEGIGGGRNAFLMLGSVGSQMLSGQLANSLNITLNNIERNKRAAEDLRVSLDNLSKIKTFSVIDNKALQQVIEYKNILNDLSSAMNEKQYAEGNKYIQDIEAAINENSKLSQEVQNAIQIYLDMQALPDYQQEDLKEKMFNSGYYNDEKVEELKKQTENAIDIITKGYKELDRINESMANDTTLFETKKNLLGITEAFNSIKSVIDSGTFHDLVKEEDLNSLADIEFNLNSIKGDFEDLPDDLEAEDIIDEDFVDRIT
jgi:hypothetical protein